MSAHRTQASNLRGNCPPSVTIPRVPSLPTNSFVRSGPTLLFLARLRVLTTSPFGSTTVTLSTLSRATPYRTALVPDALVPMIPPIW